MRVTRVHVDATLDSGARIALSATAAGHLRHALRAEVGDPCVLFNGDGHDYGARIVAADKRGVEVEILERRALGNESPLRIILLQSLARGEKMDLIMRKATELGVVAFVPVTSEHSQVKLDNARAETRTSHWHGIIAAACGQSGRGTVPSLSSPQPLIQALAALPPTLCRLLLDPQARGGLRDLGDIGDQVVLAIGPEGGWSLRDLETLQAAGFAGLRLGPRVLRTETAGIAGIAALQARFGDFT